MKKLVLSFGLILLLSSLVFAGVDLINEDGKNYDLEVGEGSITKHTAISSGTTVPDMCDGDCNIKIKDGASIEAKDGDQIVIKNGALSVK